MPRRGESSKRVQHLDSLGAKCRGNISLFAFTATLLIFWFWNHSFDYPPSVNLKVLGWGRFNASWLNSIHSLILGGLGLSGFLSSKSATDILKNFHHPYQLLPNDLKQLYSSWGCMAFAVLSMILFIVACFANVTAVVNVTAPKMELVLTLENDPDVLLLQQKADGGYEIGREARLSEGKSVHLVLRGFEASARAVLRDRYNLTTLEAFRVGHEWFGVTVDELDLSLAVSPSALSSHEARLLEASGKREKPLATSRWTLTISDDFRYHRKVPNHLIGQSGTFYGPFGERYLFLNTTTGESCPAKAPGNIEEIQDFWDMLCEHRESVSEWRSKPISWNGERGQVGLKIPEYEIEILVVHTSLPASVSRVEPIGIRARHLTWSSEKPARVYGVEDVGAG